MIKEKRRADGGSHSKTLADSPVHIKLCAEVSSFFCQIPRTMELGISAQFFRVGLSRKQQKRYSVRQVQAARTIAYLSRIEKISKSRIEDMRSWHGQRCLLIRRLLM
jgi:hypothetical protein